MTQAMRGMNGPGMSKSGMTESGMTESGMSKSGMNGPGMSKSGMTESGMTESGTVVESREDENSEKWQQLNKIKLTNTCVSLMGACGAVSHQEYNTAKWMQAGSSSEQSLKRKRWSIVSKQDSRGGNIVQGVMAYSKPKVSIMDACVNLMGACKAKHSHQIK